MSEPSEGNTEETTSLARLRAEQLRFGWGALAIFMFGGLALETMHGFKLGWYLDVGNDTRRLMFQLAHAHGTLLGLTNIAFALSLTHLTEGRFPRADLASRSLKFATILVPGGFFAGGIIIHDGDPGLGIVAVPLGALGAILAGYLTWRALGQEAP